MHIPSGIGREYLQGHLIARGGGFWRKERGGFNHFGQQLHRGNLQIRIQRGGPRRVPRSKAQKERAAWGRMQENGQFSEPNFHRTTGTAAFLSAVVDPQTCDAR